MEVPGAREVEALGAVMHLVRPPPEKRDVVQETVHAVGDDVARR